MIVELELELELELEHFYALFLHLLYTWTMHSLV
jgi:hypothetical protein